MQLETDLRRAVVGEQFKLYFQPTISLESGEIVGFEALIRWQHPEKGLINPADFIPLAEETGIIVPMGNWVLIAACRQIRRWKESFPSIPLFVSVNISSRQFSQTDLIDRIQGTLQETGMDSSALKLEITETVLMENKEAAREVLNKIKSLGIDIYMDDFGTGYSSLSHLHRFPVDLLKIDQSFVSNMHRNRQNLEIVRTILALTQNLKIEATAEGVETAEQMEQLKADGCTYAQGYYFAKPLDPESAVELLSGKRRLF
ncbi:Cyclic di-GMP phosphodiesterase PdeR [subsurface metagenome]